MSQSPNRPRWTSGCAYLIAILVLIALLCACASYPTIPVTGRLANTPISTTVDSELAKYYLAVSSGHSPGNANVAERINSFERRFRTRPLDWLTLRELSEESSPDFATIFFINRCLSDHTDERFQSGYSSELQRIKSLIDRRRWARIPRIGLRGYKILFIPGFHYLGKPTSGAVFSYQRRMMRE
jgi:hypothetical protein